MIGFKVRIKLQVCCFRSPGFANAPLTVCLSLQAKKLIHRAWITGLYIIQHPDNADLAGDVRLPDRHIIPPLFVPGQDLGLGDTAAGWREGGYWLVPGRERQARRED